MFKVSVNLRTTKLNDAFFIACVLLANTKKKKKNVNIRRKYKMTFGSLRQTNNEKNIFLLKIITFIFTFMYAK